VGSKTRVLIVDDDGDFCDFYKRILEEEGYEVEVAGDGHEGLAKALAGGYRLILLDIRMPGMDGMEVLKQLHEGVPKRENGKVVMMTSYADSDMSTGARMMGAAGYVMKVSGADPGQFVKMVKGYLE